MENKIKEKLEKHINKILDKKKLKIDDITLLSILLMSNDMSKNNVIKEKGDK